MREFKIVGAGACALLAIGTLFSLLGSQGQMNSVGLAGRIVGILILGALAAWLWRSANRRRPPQI